MAETLTISGTAGNMATIAISDYYPSTMSGSSWTGELLYHEMSGGVGTPMTETRTYQVINKKEEVRDMRGLFQVYVIDPKKETVIGNILVIAKNEKSAEIKALTKAMPFDEFDIDDLDIVTVKLGSIRAKKEVQKVCVVKED